MDPIKNMINTSMASTEEKHDQSCSILLKSLIALNEQNGKSIDEAAISKVIEEHKECMSKYLQKLSFDLTGRVTDALQNRRIADKEKMKKLANIAKELVDAWKEDESQMKTDDYFGTNFQNIELHGNDLLVYNAIKSNNSEFGISRSELATQFSNIPSHELWQIIDLLNGVGLCYSTIDPDHFMVSDL